MRKVNTTGWEFKLYQRAGMRELHAYDRQCDSSIRCYLSPNFDGTYALHISRKLGGRYCEESQFEQCPWQSLDMAAIYASAAILAFIQGTPLDFAAFASESCGL